MADQLFGPAFRCGAYCSADAFSLGVALSAFKLGEKQTTLQKTFGYKRFEILTAMFNGLSLVLIAAMIFYEAVKRLFYPPEILTGGMLVVSIIGLLVNIGVAVYMLKNSDTEEKRQYAWRVSARNQRFIRFDRGDCCCSTDDGVWLAMGGYGCHAYWWRLW